MDIAANVTVNVTDDDSEIILSVDPDSITEGAGETDVTVTATRGNNVDTTDAIEIDSFSLGGTATEGASGDYTVTGELSSITIPAGQSSGTGTLTITTVNDNVAESDETITVSGSADKLSVAPATITITDDDFDITLSVDVDTIAEGAGATQVTVTATRNDASSDAKTVNLTVSGTAVNPADYAISPTPLTSITINENQTSGDLNLTITPVDDSIQELDETIIFTGTSGTLSVEPVTVTITDNEPDIILSVEPDSAVEGSTPEVTMTATRAGTEGEIQVSTSYAAGTADQGTDWTVLFSGRSITIPDGATSASNTQNFDLVQDDDVEGDETFEVQGTVASLTVESASFTIIDDDFDISLSAEPASVLEDDGATEVTVTATRNDDSDTAERVITFSPLGGTANDPADYTATSLASITILTNEKIGTTTFILTPKVDADSAEGTETITVTGTTTGKSVGAAEIAIIDLGATKPAAPAVTRTQFPLAEFPQGANPALDATWSAPTTAGLTVESYLVRYRKDGETDWTTYTYATPWGDLTSRVPGDTTSVNLPDVGPGATYEVQVRISASNNGASPWSEPAQEKSTVRRLPPRTNYLPPSW